MAKVHKHAGLHPESPNRPAIKTLKFACGRWWYQMGMDADFARSWSRVTCKRCLKRKERKERKRG